MFTYEIWKNCIIDTLKNPWEKLNYWIVFGIIILTPFAIIIDLLSSPWQIISLIVYKILKRREKNDNKNEQ